MQLFNAYNNIPKGMTIATIREIKNRQIDILTTINYLYCIKLTQNIIPKKKNDLNIQYFFTLRII